MESQLLSQFSQFLLLSRNSQFSVLYNQKINELYFSIVCDIQYFQSLNYSLDVEEIILEKIRKSFRCNYDIDSLIYLNIYQFRIRLYNHFLDSWLFHKYQWYQKNSDVSKDSFWLEQVYLRKILKLFFQRYDRKIVASEDLQGSFYSLVFHYPGFFKILENEKVFDMLFEDDTYKIYEKERVQKDILAYLKLFNSYDEQQFLAMLKQDKFVFLFELRLKLMKRCYSQDIIFEWIESYIDDEWKKKQLREFVFTKTGGFLRLVKP